jgi:hypothetical protein
VNITLSADAETVARTRRYAHEHGTSVNQLVRDFLDSLTGQDDRNQVADEFARNAVIHGGKSPPGFRFDREQSHFR